MAESNGFLIDTHFFIWSMDKTKNLSLQIKSLIEDPRNDIFISVASVWEMIIKRSLGKLKLPRDIERGIKSAGFKILAIEISHVLGVEKLPPHHKDPFDRLLVAQAKAVGLIILTDDSKIKKYNVAVLN